MNLEAVNFMLSTYYDSVASLNYILRDLIDNPETTLEKSENEKELQIEIKVLKKLIAQLEQIKENLQNFGI